MNKLTFLRKPLKPMLIATLLVLTSTATLVFCLQALLDALVIEHCMNSTAYVGTLYSWTQKYPMLKDIPADVLQALADSDTVDDVMAVSVYSARAEGVASVRDGFGATESLNMKLFVEGTVESEPVIAPSAFGMMETFTLRIITLWGGSWPGNSIRVDIIRDGSTGEAQLKTGDHIFLVGRYNCGANGDVTGMLLYDPQAVADMGDALDSPIWNHPILVLPEGLSAGASAARIERFLLESGLEDSWAMMGELGDMFAVHEVEDMSMLLTVVDGTTFVTQGRELRASDAGSRVCMISEAVAGENGLVVGDTIQLSIAPGCYTYRSDDFEDLYGWNSGYPFEGDVLLEYPGYGGFEIVGIYSEIGREVGRADYRHHTRNDIFIPGGILPAASAGAEARSVTFRILGPDYQDFMDEFEIPLHEEGYALSLVDSGWEVMSGSFYAMSDRRTLMTAYAAAALVVAVLSFGVLLSGHFRYEFALRRLLGAYPGQAAGIYISGFLVTAVPAVLLSVGCSFGAYCLWLKGQAAAGLPVALPPDTAILARLALWAGGELAAAFAVLMACVLVTGKRSLVRLLK